MAWYRHRNMLVCIPLSWLKNTITDVHYLSKVAEERWVTVWWVSKLQQLLLVLLRNGCCRGIYCLLTCCQATSKTTQATNPRLTGNCCTTKTKIYNNKNTTYTTTTTVLWPFFPGPPGWAGVRRELLDFMVKGEINRGRHTDHPAGHHSIWTNQCPPPPFPHIFYRPDALPATQPTVSKNWRQLAHSDWGEDARVLLNGVTYIVSVPYHLRTLPSPYLTTYTIQLYNAGYVCTTANKLLYTTE